MPYVRIDDGFPEHPKVLGLTDAQKWAWVAALCYAHRNRTDGHIPAAYLRRAVDARALVTARLWVPDPEDNGWLIHDYLGWNPSRAELEDRARVRAERAKKAARARWDGHHGDDA